MWSDPWQRVVSAPLNTHLSEPLSKGQMSPVPYCSASGPGWDPGRRGGSPLRGASLPSSAGQHPRAKPPEDWMEIRVSSHSASSSY